MCLCIPSIESCTPFHFEEALESVGMQERAAGQGLTVSFAQEAGPGYFAAVDGEGKLQEVGWVKIPSLQTLSWAAQWLQYQRNLQAKLDEDALVVPVFESEVQTTLALQP